MFSVLTLVLLKTFLLDEWGVIVKNPADGATAPKREEKQLPM